jgi:antagonist of KipI
MPSLTVIRPGMLTTVQDLGRWGHQRLGIPVAGAMDWYSHAEANRRLGNPETAATLEITLLGPELEADGDVTCAVAGAVFELFVDGVACAPTSGVIRLTGGQRLRFGARNAGARAFLAADGGLLPPATLGSRSTSLAARMGPFGGRALKAGDVLPVGESSGAQAGRPASLRLPGGGARLRVMRGPHDDRFTPEAMKILTTERYSITPESNRMGYRLSGTPLAHLGSADILSDATCIGSLQVPASGQPILLMADRQTTGGYAKIATVITADLPLAGQLAPGDWVEFALCSRAEASQALSERLAALRGDAA